MNEFGSVYCTVSDSTVEGLAVRTCIQIMFQDGKSSIKGPTVV